MATKKTAKKSPAKKSPARKSTAADEGTTESTNESAAPSGAEKSAPSKRVRKSTDAPRSARKRAASGNTNAPSRKRLTGPSVATAAARQLLELTGREIEGVTGLEKTEDGWLVHVDAVEVRRIPDTTDILALYEIQVDSEGDMVGYRRLRRYTRGVPGEE